MEHKTRLVSFNFTVEDMAKLIGAVKLDDGKCFDDAWYFCHAFEHLVEFVIYTKYGVYLNDVPQVIEISGSDIPATSPNWDAIFLHSPVRIVHSSEITMAILAPFDRMFKVVENVNVVGGRYLDKNGFITPHQGEPFFIKFPSNRLVRQAAVTYFMREWGPKELMCTGHNIEVSVW